MIYCDECGSRLIDKKNEEGLINKYCPVCQKFKYPLYNVAVSMIVVDRQTNHILLIKQYGKDANILVAGYVNKGESLEEAVIREVKEETNLDVRELVFNKSKYFPPSNSLMNNFVAFVVNASEIECNFEVDSFAWYTKEEAVVNIKKASLAKEFLCYYIENMYI